MIQSLKINEWWAVYFAVFKYSRIRNQSGIPKHQQRRCFDSLFTEMFNHQKAGVEELFSWSLGLQKNMIYQPTSWTNNATQPNHSWCRICFTRENENDPFYIGLVFPQKYSGIFREILSSCQVKTEAVKARYTDCFAVLTQVCSCGMIPILNRTKCDLRIQSNDSSE